MGFAISACNAVDVPIRSDTVFFPQPAPQDGPTAITAALGSGTLALENGCLWLKNRGDADLIIWPAAYRLDTSDGRLSVLDATGATFAVVGGPINIGGGELTRAGQTDIDARVESKIGRTIPAVCRLGFYWDAAGGPIVGPMPQPTDVAFGPRTSPGVPCAADDPRGPIPGIDLVTPDGVRHRGQPYASTWAGSVIGPAGGDALIPKTAANGGAGHPIQIVIDGETCAINWYIAYGPMPPGGPAPWKFMPVAELVPSVAQNNDPVYAAQNRFDLAPLPVGDWLIGVELSFRDGLELVWFRVSAG